jgi:glycosyltransferase domain-containing protein
MSGTQHAQNSLTMVIPTRNRSDYLERLLFYYFSIGFEHKIIISDSSEKDHLIHNKNTIQKVNSKLKITHEIYDEKIELKNKVFPSLSHVETSYTVLGADDDFFVPKSLDSAVDFLENNPDYSTVSGESLSFCLDSQCSHGKITFLGEYPRTTIDDDDMSCRLIKHLSNYAPTWYSVHRTNSLINYWNILQNYPGDIVFFELLPSCLSIIDGKAKKMDCLYMVSQADANKSYTPLNSKLDWISNPDWEIQYSLFRQILCEYLVLKANTDMGTAKKTVNTAFALYIAPLLSTECQNETNKHWVKKRNSLLLTVNLSGKFLFHYFMDRPGLKILLTKLYTYKLKLKTPRIYSDLQPVIEVIEKKPDISPKDNNQFPG